MKQTTLTCDKFIGKICPLKLKRLKKAQKNEKTKYCKFGGDCYMYGMLAAGLIDIVIEDTLKGHDYMALIPVIEGAGGIVSDRFGKKISLESDGSFVASCSQNIHNQVIQLLNS